MVASWRRDILLEGRRPFAVQDSASEIGHRWKASKGKIIGKTLAFFLKGELRFHPKGFQGERSG